MSDVTLKATVTKNGKSFFTNPGVIYHDMSGDALTFFLSKLDGITKHTQDVHAKSKKAGPFSVTLGILIDGQPAKDANGQPVPDAVFDGLSSTEFHALERHRNKVELDTIDTSERVNKQHGKA